MIPANTRAVIFDMDGLLINSEPYWNKADVQFFGKRNIAFTDEIARAIRGLGQKEVFEYFQRNFGLQGNIDELIQERKEMVYEILLPDLRLRDGAKNLIERSFDEDLWLAIATAGHSQDKIKEMLQKLDILHYFSTLVSYEDVERGKPFPDIYLKASEKLKIAPGYCLVLEDAPNGVVAAKVAGMVVFGVNSDPEFRKALYEAGADKVLSSLSEIVV